MKNFEFCESGEFLLYEKSDFHIVEFFSYSRIYFHIQCSRFIYRSTTELQMVLISRDTKPCMTRTALICRKNRLRRSQFQKFRPLRRRFHFHYMKTIIYCMKSFKSSIWKCQFYYMKNFVSAFGRKFSYFFIY